VQTPERAGVEQLRILLDDVADAALDDLPAGEDENDDVYAASQSEHSSPTDKLTSLYLYPQVRRDGLVRRGGWRVPFQTPARETRAEKLKARPALARKAETVNKRSTRILSRRRKKRENLESPATWMLSRVKWSMREARKTQHQTSKQARTNKNICCI
jgi:hypothetical protein